MTIPVKQIPSEYKFKVTQEEQYGKYDLVLIVPPQLQAIADDWDKILEEKPF